MGFDARTPVPTVFGWKPAALIEPGDTVFSYDGQPTKVVSVQEYTPAACYKLWMPDNLTLVVDGRTGLPTITHLQMEILRKWGRKEKRHKEMLIEPRGPQALMEDKRNKRLINCWPLQMPERELPVDPFVIGQWIFDRSKRRRDRRYDITRQLIEKYPTIPQYIPEEYFFASFAQRLNLVRGIFADMGSFNPKLSTFMYTCRNYKMLRQVQNIIESLGITTKMTQHGNEQRYHLTFKTFLKLRDDQTSNGREFYFEFRMVKRVEEVAPRKCFYIKTENPDNTVVVSEGYLPICL